MDLETLKANSVGINNIELEKQRMLESAYNNMMEGKTLDPQQVGVLNEYVDTADKLQKAKATNMSLESLMDRRKFAEKEDLEKEETEAYKEDEEREEKEEEEEKSFPPKKKDDQKEKKDGESEEESSSEEDEDCEKEAMGLNDLNEEEVLMSSLIKDTPSGNYSNTLAKMRAESDIDKQNYTRAFRNLQNKANQNYQYMLASDADLSHPDRIGNTNKNFQLLNEFAPALAANPITAKSFIKKMDAYGDQIDEQTIGELIRTNSEFMKHQVRMT